MRSRLIRTLSLSAAAAVLALGLTACGGSDDDISANTATSTEADSGTDADDAAQDIADDTEDGDDSDDAGDFCAMVEEGAATVADMTDESIESMDLQSIVLENSAKLQNMTPPAEIADEFAAYAAAYQEVADTIAALDPNDANYQMDLVAALAALADEDVLAAQKAMNAYAMEHCNVS